MLFYPDICQQKSQAQNWQHEGTAIVQQDTPVDIAVDASRHVIA
jgi:hypothetical protein